MLRLRHAVLAALLVAGCGGDDPPTKDEFVRAADAVCRDLRRESASIRREEPQSVEELLRLTPRMRKTAENAAARVRELELPEGADRAKAEQWQQTVIDDAEKRLIPTLDALEKAARENDQQALLKALQDLQALENSRAGRLARELGMKTCGRET